MASSISPAEILSDRAPSLTCARQRSTGLALRGIERTAFFTLVRSTTVAFMYSDRELWAVVGYEGESSDQGGYVDRGFDDLDWLPDPRIEEYSAEGVQS